VAVKKETKENKITKKTTKKVVEPAEKHVVRGKYSNADSSPQKMRLVADLIRGKGASEAVNILTYTNKKGAKTMLKLLKSVVANADSLHGLKEDSLVVSLLDVGEGIKFPRYRIASRGRVNKLIRRRSLIKIELTEK